MNPQSDGVAVITQIASRKVRHGPVLKAGFLNKQNGKTRHDLIATSRTTSPSMAKPSDSTSHADGEEEKAAANVTFSADQDEPPAELPPPVPKFEAVRPPELLAVDTTSLHLQWPSVCQLPLEVPVGCSSGAGDDPAELPSCEVEYCLESRMVSCLLAGTTLHDAVDLLKAMNSPHTASDVFYVFHQAAIPWSLQESNSRGPRNNGQEPWKICYRGKDTIKKVCECVGLDFQLPSRRPLSDLHER